MRNRPALMDPPPAEAQTIGNLRIYRFEQDGKLYAKIWKGRQTKPFAYYRFRDGEHRESFIARQIENDAAAEKARAERKANDAKRLSEMVESLQVGTILHYSWGYDQTQCEYFQIVAKKGRQITLREIGSRIVPGSEGFMCDRRQPARNKFIGEPITKRVGPYGVAMRYGHATPCADDEANYCSWYA